MLFNSDITLFIFGWDDLSIGESGILKSPRPLLWGSIWNFTYSRSCFMNCMHLCLGQRLEPHYCLGEGFLWSVCSGLFITSFGWQSVLSGIRIERSCLLHPSPWNSLFLLHPVLMSVCCGDVSLGSRKGWLLLHALLMYVFWLGELGSLTFRVITERCVFIPAILLVL